MTNARFNLQRQFTGAFTVIEILIVVIVLGVLTSLVVPQFSSSPHDAHDATLRDCLRYLRTQIQTYRIQHGDIPPGYPTDDTTQLPNATTFVAQLTQYSDNEGRVGGTRTAAMTFGPYLSEMPANPVSLQNGILVVNGATLPAPDPSQPYGWIYCPLTQQIIPNLAGADESGTAYTSY
ncbi:MAG TPA: hypothetical protein VN541_16155 [Tepidisphaeraceae bacterium]|nr:hypothetical protein [Tepidisphaeraceae bacterium]